MARRDDGVLLHPYPWRRGVGGLVEDHRKWGGSGMMDADNAELRNTTITAWVKRAAVAWTGDKDDPVGVETRDKGNGDSVGATVAAYVCANIRDQMKGGGIKC